MTLSRAEFWVPDATTGKLTRRGRGDVDPGPPPPPPPPAGATKFGWYAGNVPPASGTRASYDYVKTYLGDPTLKGCYRMFNSGSPGNNFVGSSADYGPPVVVSFKFPPTEITAGTHDTTMNSWFNSIPVNRQVYWSFHHEPENDIKAGSFTFAQYKAAWSHLLDLAPQRPTLRGVCILMGYSTYPSSGRTISNYVTTHPDLYGLWWDSYLTSGSKTIDGVYTVPKQYSNSFGLTHGICETGVSSGFVQAGLTHDQTVAKFVPDLIANCKAGGSIVCTWFETDKHTTPGDDNWRLSPDYPTQIARWKQAVETGV